MNVQTFTFNGFQENTFILIEQQECIIIDPGCYTPDEQQVLADFIASEKLKPVRLINTHFHLDHILGNHFVSKRYGLPVEGHKKGEVTCVYAKRSAEMYGFTNYIDTPPIKNYLKEGDIVKLGNSSLNVLFVPGHAPGHIVLYCEKDDFIIAGDTLFNGSIGRTDLPGGDFKTLEERIKTQLYTLPESCTVHCGHGPSTTIGAEKYSNPFVSITD